MSLTRLCEACHKVIPKATHLELSLAVKRTHGGESQDPIENVYGDYCDQCVRNGKALADLLTGVKYTLRAK